MTKDYSYTLVNTDLCLPDYFSGDSRPWLCVPVYPMNIAHLKGYLLGELSQGAIGGNMDYEERESEEFYIACKKAINNLTLNDNLPSDHILFKDYPIDENEDEYTESVYAYFVFIED